MSERISEDTIDEVNSAAPAVTKPTPAKAKPPVPAPVKSAVGEGNKMQTLKDESVKTEKSNETGSAKASKDEPMNVSDAMAELRKELAEVRELKDSLKQKEAVFAAQIKRVDEKVFGATGSTVNDQDRHQTKSERMKEWIWSHKMKPVYIPLESGEKRGHAVQPVTKNGYRLNVPKGVWIEVPEPIAKKVMERVEQSDAALDNKFRLDKATPAKLEALTG